MIDLEKKIDLCSPIDPIFNTDELSTSEIQEHSLSINSRFNVEMDKNLGITIENKTQEMQNVYAMCSGFISWYFKGDSLTITTGTNNTFTHIFERNTLVLQPNPNTFNAFFFGLNLGVPQTIPVAAVMLNGYTGTRLISHIFYSGGVNAQGEEGLTEDKIKPSLKALINQSAFFSNQPVNTVVKNFFSGETSISVLMGI